MPPFFWTNKDAVRDFISKHGKGPSSKDYEFVAALILVRFCEEQFGSACHIGFELSGSHAREVPNQGFSTLEEVANILRKKVEQRTPVDVAITPDTMATGKRRGVSFQLKRFGKDPRDKTTDDLLRYLNEDIPKAYQPGMRITLMLILETGTELDLPRVINELQTENYPFERIMYMGTARDKIIVGELFPNQGSSEYELSHFAMHHVGPTGSPPMDS